MNWGIVFYIPDEPLDIFCKDVLRETKRMHLWPYISDSSY